ncbi:MAG: hypothetical protein M3O91_03440 [Chloroflexota bacterium]|nr:hypothetical protein [Chloroflexota bacterium]
MRARSLIAAVAVVGATVSLPTPSAATKWCGSLADLFPDGVTTLQGDVDADHRIDTVSTSARWLGDQTCRAWLTIDTSKGTYRRRIDPLFGSLVAPPALAGLIRLGPGPRLDVAVVVMLGASTGFVDVYGLQGRELRRRSSEAFAHAGSVVNRDRAGVDCATERGARLVASLATFEADNRYHVQRTFYAVPAGALRTIPGRTERTTVRFNGLNRYPESASQVPFPSCAVVRGPS